MAYIEKTSGETDRTIALINKGDSIEGFYQGYKEIDDQFNEGKKTKLHIFQTSEEKVGVWGKTYLDSKLTADLLGCQCYIEMTGMIPPKKKGRRPAYGYKVLFDKEKKMEYSSVSLPSTIEVGDVDDTSFDPESFDSPAKAKVSNNRR